VLGDLVQQGAAGYQVVSVRWQLAGAPHPFAAPSGLCRDQLEEHRVHVDSCHAPRGADRGTGPLDGAAVAAAELQAPPTLAHPKSGKVPQRPGSRILDIRSSGWYSNVAASLRMHGLIGLMASLKSARRPRYRQAASTTETQADAGRSTLSPAAARLIWVGRRLAGRHRSGPTTSHSARSRRWSRSVPRSQAVPIRGGGAGCARFYRDLDDRSNSANQPIREARPLCGVAGPSPGGSWTVRRLVEAGTCRCRVLIADRGSGREPGRRCRRPARRPRGPARGAAAPGRGAPGSGAGRPACGWLATGRGAPTP
jgi:hypothetical protein